jgi:hypothetical protein
MTEEINHIGIEVPESMPEIFLDNIVADLNTDGLKLKIQRRPELGVMNALEWIIPTVIATYIFKSYFDGFLKEAGKDHYTALRNWLKKFAESGRLINVQTIYASQSTNKQPNKNTQSKSVSLLLQTKNGKIIKLLFDNDLAKEDWDNAIDQLLDFAIDNYENHPNDILTKRIEKLELNTRHRIYAVIDKESKELIFYGDRDLMKLQSALPNL